MSQPSDIVLAQSPMGSDSSPVTSRRSGRLRRLRQRTATVRFRITALATLAVLIVLVGASVALVLTQRNVLTAELDESLSARLDDVEALVATGETPPVLVAGGDEDTVVQVVDTQGRVLASTANVEGEPPIADPHRRGGDRSDTPWTACRTTAPRSG